MRFRGRQARHYCVHHYGCIMAPYTAKPYHPLNSQTQKASFRMQFAEEEGAIVGLWRLTMTKKCAQTAAFGRMSSNLFTLRRQRGPFF